MNSNSKMAALVVLLVSAIVFCATPVAAGSVVNGAEGASVWQAGVDGIEVEWNADGSVKRISSKYVTPVEFGDRRGISKAQIICEEKAKAAIIRFFKQTVSSARISSELQNDLNRATQERETGRAPNVKKVDERTMLGTFMEVTTSVASGELAGVVVLEKGYDEKSEQAWAVVGISEKTIRASRDAKAMGRSQEPAERRAEPSGPDGLKTQPGELRRRQTDW